VNENLQERKILTEKIPPNPKNPDLEVEIRIKRRAHQGNPEATAKAAKEPGEVVVVARGEEDHGTKLMCLVVILQMGIVETGTTAAGCMRKV